MSWRRLWSLLEQLPREARYIRAVVGESTQWGWTEHLLASVFDAVQTNTWVVASAAGSRGKRPQLIQRPGVVSEKQPNRIGTGRHTTSEIDRILAGFAAQGAVQFTSEEVR